MLPLGRPFLGHHFQFLAPADFDRPRHDAQLAATVIDPHVAANVLAVPAPDAAGPLGQRHALDHAFPSRRQHVLHLRPCLRQDRLPGHGDPVVRSHARLHPPLELDPAIVFSGCGHQISTRRNGAQSWRTPKGTSASVPRSVTASRFLYRWPRNSRTAAKSEGGAFHRDTRQRKRCGDLRQRLPASAHRSWEAHHRGR